MMYVKRDLNATCHFQWRPENIRSVGSVEETVTGVPWNIRVGTCSESISSFKAPRLVHPNVSRVPANLQISRLDRLNSFFIYCIYVFLLSFIVKHLWQLVYKSTHQNYLFVVPNQQSKEIQFTVSLQTLNKTVKDLFTTTENVPSYSQIPGGTIWNKMIIII